MTPGGEETIRLAVPAQGWLADYERALERSALGAISREVVLQDSRYIGDSAALSIDDARWGEARVRTGAVMGAVQSGKTASMIGVVASSLDQGVNVVVVLAGTQVSLWQQGLSRIRSQLDAGPGARMRRVLVPNSDYRRGGPSAIYNMTDGQVTRALTRGRPIIAVAMKQVDHLLHLGQVLHNVVYPAAEAAGVAIRLLVVDDEADDSSIADEGLPWGSPDLEVYKQVPRRIVDLWESRRQPGRTVSESVFATYVAYTATPQANFLQDPQNPLAPRDFVASLRTPGPEGSVTPRTLTYRVPEGLNGWYTGADIFYGDLASSLCLVGNGTSHDEAEPSEDESPGDPTPSLDTTMVIDATRAFLVAAAVRLSRFPGRYGPRSGRDRIFASKAEVIQNLAPVSSMLVHPSSAMESHFEVADLIRAWWDGAPGGIAGGVVDDIDQNEPLWRAWVDSYRLSAERATDAFELPGASPSSRTVPAWEELRDLLIKEIVPATTIAVVNSDPNADERPSFEPWFDDAGWHSPRNQSTIFVAGNVMSRGLTLEGLLTTLFTRSSSAPLEDSQTQMQRWFGYRGTYIDLCRVFLTEEQFSLFTRYADDDHALRSQVLAAMESPSGPIPDFTVLQGHSFRATAKVSGLVGRQLRPGSRPFVSHLNPVGADRDNLALVANLLQRAESAGRLKKDKRGLVTLDELSLLDTADLLDELCYEDHGLVPFEAARWRALEKQAHLGEGDLEFPLYRPPPVDSGGVDLGARSPYVIAAYLRFWAACLDRKVRGVLSDDLPPQRWSLLNLEDKRVKQPRFRVGVRFGGGVSVGAGPFARLSDALDLEIKPMARDTAGGALAADWGSRKAVGAGYVGDDLFDIALLGEEPRLHEDGSRQEGCPGLLLFHFVQRLPDQSGGIALGLSIPRGGPDHVEAVSSARRRNYDA